MESMANDFLFHEISRSDLQQQKARDVVCVLREIEKLLSLMLVCWYLFELHSQKCHDIQKTELHECSMLLSC